MDALDLVIFTILSVSAANPSDFWLSDWNFGFGSVNSPHSLPYHVHIPSQKSVCDKMMSWLEMLGHNNSYSCQPLPKDIHEVIPEFCAIAGVETFNICKDGSQEQLSTEACLGEFLQDFEEKSVLFDRCLCHGYVENYAAMWTIWRMMCEDPVHYHPFYPPYFPNEDYVFSRFGRSSVFSEHSLHLRDEDLLARNCWTYGREDCWEAYSYKNKVFYPNQCVNSNSFSFCKVNGSMVNCIESKPCVFPFIYRGEEYHDCTTVNNGMNNGQSWCSTETQGGVFDMVGQETKWNLCKECRFIVKSVRKYNTLN